MAEQKGFEPLSRIKPTDCLVGNCIKPLCHCSFVVHSRDFVHDFETLPSRINDIALDAGLHSYVQ